MALKLKMDGDKVALSSDGHPIYVDDSTGTETPVNGPAALAKITELQGEAKRHRERGDELQTRVQLFDGIDVEKAKAALATVANLDQSKLIEAGKVDELKAGLIKANEEATKKLIETHNAALEAEKKRVAELESAFYSEKVGGAFARSKFISDKIAVPAAMMQATFGANFKVEDGKIIPYGADGNRLFSRSKHGEVADFEEGLEILVDAFPNRDQIMKGTGGGAGAKGGGGGGGAGDKTIPRSKFEALSHVDKAAKMKEGVKVVAD